MIRGLETGLVVIGVRVRHDIHLFVINPTQVIKLLERLNRQRLGLALSVASLREVIRVGGGVGGGVWWRELNY